jgi:hypothetical protein
MTCYTDFVSNLCSPALRPKCSRCKNIQYEVTTQLLWLLIVLSPRVNSRLRLYMTSLRSSFLHAIPRDTTFVACLISASNVLGNKANEQICKQNQELAFNNFRSVNVRSS